MTYKGVVKDNVVILEEGVHLPNGMKVVVTMNHIEQIEDVFPEEQARRQALVARMKEFGQGLARRQVNLGTLILDAREELEDRA